MSVLTITSRYAKSLLDLAVEQDVLETIYQDMVLFNDVTQSNNDFVLMLKSPIISEDKKIKILDLIFSEKLSRMTLKFFTIVIRKRREFYLPRIAKSFIEQYNERKSISKVSFTTAEKIDTETQNDIIKIVSEATQTENIDLNLKIDKSIIGGFILQYEDKQYDASIFAKLEEMQKEFNKNTYIKKY